MTRLLLLLTLSVPLAACGADGRIGDSATRTEPSATEPGVNISGYARVGVARTF
jgi:hypothetical protein